MGRAISKISLLSRARERKHKRIFPATLVSNPSKLSILKLLTEALSPDRLQTLTLIAFVSMTIPSLRIVEDDGDITGHEVSIKIKFSTTTVV